MSVGGSTAATGNAGGFCLVSDRNASKTGFANFALLMTYPYALQFVRVPSKTAAHLMDHLLSRAPNRQWVLSFPIRIGYYSPPIPACSRRYRRSSTALFPSSEQQAGLYELEPDERRHPSPVFWLSRPLTCNGLPATIAGTFGNDTLVGTPGNDIMHGWGGNDVIHGLQGNDVICGGAGNDQLSGNQGKDRLFGEAGNDVLKGGINNDRLFGQEGHDAMDGQRGNDDNCNGGIGADTARSCEQPRKCRSPEPGPKLG